MIAIFKIFLLEFLSISITPTLLIRVVTHDFHDLNSLSLNLNYSDSLIEYIDLDNADDTITNNTRV